MRRYIDAEAFYEELRKETAGYSKQEQRSGEDYSWIWRKEFYHVFNNFPAADVQEVRHGRWLSELKGEPVSLDENGDVTTSAYCSECQSWLVGSDEYACKGRFCPNCGAKMDEVKE